MYLRASKKHLGSVILSLQKPSEPVEEGNLKGQNWNFVRICRREMTVNGSSMHLQAPDPNVRNLRQHGLVVLFYAWIDLSDSTKPQQVWSLLGLPR